MMNQKTAANVKGINCVYLPASNLIKSADWYVNNLGLVLLNEITDDSTQAQLQISAEQFIFLIKTEKKSNLTFVEVDGNEQCILTLEVLDIKALHEQLRSNLVEMEEVQNNNECGLSFSVKDPDGNKIDIWGGWG